MTTARPVPFDLGILTGSGPDAGIDLWQAVLGERRRRLGADYRGDGDAPSVLIHSDPALATSMQLPHGRDLLGAIMADHAHVLDRSCAAWAIACNTLHTFVPDLRRAAVADRLVSFVDVAAAALQHATSPVALLGARPVAALGAESPYTPLTDRLVRLDTATISDLHALIADVKRTGADTAARSRFRRLADRIGVDTMLLACTELPLVADADDPRFVDLTRLVAAALLDTVEASARPDRHSHPQLPHTHPTDHVHEEHRP